MAASTKKDTAAKPEADAAKAASKPDPKKNAGGPRGQTPIAQNPSLVDIRNEQRKHAQAAGEARRKWLEDHPDMAMLLELIGEQNAALMEGIRGNVGALEQAMMSKSKGDGGKA